MQLRQTKSAAQVEAYGEEIGPLPLAGAYLNQCKALSVAP